MFMWYTALKALICFCCYVLGLAVSKGELRYGLDGKPYTALLYGNGEGFQGPDVNVNEPHTRQDLTSVDTSTIDSIFISRIFLKSLKFIYLTQFKL